MISNEEKNSTSESNSNETNKGMRQFFSWVGPYIYNIYTTCITNDRSPTPTNNMNHHEIAWRLSIVALHNDQIKSTNRSFPRLTLLILLYYGAYLIDFLWLNLHQSLHLFPVTVQDRTWFEGVRTHFITRKTTLVNNHIGSSSSICCCCCLQFVVIVVVLLRTCYSNQSSFSYLHSFVVVVPRFHQAPTIFHTAKVTVRPRRCFF